MWHKFERVSCSSFRKAKKAQTRAKLETNTKHRQGPSKDSMSPDSLGSSYLESQCPAIMGCFQ